MGVMRTKAKAIRDWRQQTQKHLNYDMRIVAKEAQEEAPARDFSKYRGRPGAYMKEILGFDQVWDKIIEAMESLNRPPYKTLVKSGHKIGKSCSAGALINYWFDCYDPGVVITTGPSYEAMIDTVWSEVRMQRFRAGLPDCFVGSVSPELWTSPDHWAKLFNVTKTEAFQGKHRPRMLFLFDECVGVDRPMWTVAKTMFKPEEGNAWIGFFNPTDPSKWVYQEEQSGEWNVMNLSSLDHPNIVQQLEARSRGIEQHSRELPIPNAVSLSMVDGWVKEWTMTLDSGSSPEATDFQWQWPDGSKEWRRPLLDWEARCTGNWPTQSVSAVWSDHLVTVCSKLIAPIPIHLLPEIGVDVARDGDDKTAIHQRYGCRSLHHEARGGLKTTETAGWCIEVVRGLAEMVNHLRTEERGKRPVVDPKHVPMKIDDDGVGGGVVDILREQGYNVIPVKAGSNALDVTRYPNKRSELWFSTVRRASSSGIALSGIDKESMRRIKLQALAPTWKLDSIGRRVVEPKAETKKRLGRSPDDMDAMNLAYYEVGDNIPSSEYIPAWDDPHLGPSMTEEGKIQDRGEQYKRQRRKLFG